MCGIIISILITLFTYFVLSARNFVASDLQLIHKKYKSLIKQKLIIYLKKKLKLKIYVCYNCILKRLL